MYKIHFEGRSKEEVIREGNTFRLDLTPRAHTRNVSELKGFEFEAKKGHELPNGTRVFYVTIKAKEQTKKMPSKKRYVLKSANELGIDSGYVDEKGKWIPTWYIIDKTNNEIIESDEGEGARNRLKRAADGMNLRG